MHWRFRYRQVVEGPQVALINLGTTNFWTSSDAKGWEPTDQRGRIETFDNRLQPKPDRTHRNPIAILSVVPMPQKSAHARKSKKKSLLPFLAFLILTFAGGYYTGRFSSRNWNSETAFLYMCHFSQRLTDSSGRDVLELSTLPDAVYRYDGKDVAEIPNGMFVASESYPVVGAEEYENWLKNVFLFGAGAATKPVWDAVTDSTTVRAMRSLTAEERALASILTLGSFGGGFLLGHRFKPDFDASNFRNALRDKSVWKRVWLVKQQWRQEKAYLDIAAADLATLRKVRSENDPPDKNIEEQEKNLRESYDRLYAIDPELREQGAVVVKLAASSTHQ